MDKKWYEMSLKERNYNNKLEAVDNHFKEVNRLMSESRFNLAAAAVFGGILVVEIILDITIFKGKGIAGEIIAGGYAATNLARGLNYNNKLNTEINNFIKNQGITEEDYKKIFKTGREYAKKTVLLEQSISWKEQAKERKNDMLFKDKDRRAEKLEKKIKNIKEDIKTLKKIEIPELVYQLRKSKVFAALNYEGDEENAALIKISNAKAKKTESNNKHNIL